MFCTAKYLTKNNHLEVSDDRLNNSAMVIQIGQQAFKETGQSYGHGRLHSTVHMNIRETTN